MPALPAAPTTLRVLRGALDLVDDALVDLCALRLGLARHIGAVKRRKGLPLRDAAREAVVLGRATRRARRRGLDAAAVQEWMHLLLREARHVQRPHECVDGAAADVDQGALAAIAASVGTEPLPEPSVFALPDVSSLPLPPKALVALSLRCVPRPLQQALLEALLNRALASPLAAGKLAFLDGRVVAVEVGDLGLRWAFTRRDGRLCAPPAGCPAAATIRGEALDLVLLAGRLEDPDTLFFQRRLSVEGDTELGLTVRNLLDQLPWEDVPLGLRIVLNRAARLAQAQRARRPVQPTAAPMPAVPYQ